jgi:ATP-dependent helicase/nuclease subunit A
MARQPTPEQAEAIRTRGRHVLLEAGAGTGKTGVLVDRYCELVETGELAPDAILAFTFTDRAAAELRDRIRAELDRRAGATQDPATAERLGRLVREFGGAWITTIHGFCRRLLAAHPVAAGIDPGFDVLDASEAQRVARVAFEEALDDFLAVDDPEREATVAAYRIDGLRQLVFAAHEELRSRGHAKPRLPTPSPGDLDSAVVAVAERAAKAIGAKGERPDQLRRLERAVELCGTGATPPPLDDLDQLRIATKTGARGEFDAALRVAISRTAERGEGGVAYRHVAELVRHFGDRFAVAKERRAGLDFEDLQIFALGLLTGTELGEGYRQRFAAILVDEFQDTNRLQLGLIDALRGPEAALFLVGDEFQSIYGFRHADLEVFRARRDQLEQGADGAVLPLRGNFRSRPEVIAAANRFGALLLFGFQPLTVGAEPSPADGDGPALELLLTGCEGWDSDEIDLQLRVDDRTRPEYVAEARFLAARLRRLADAGVPRGEMVVLLRAFTRVDAFEEALERAGLRPYVVGGRGYWSQQQVEDARCLLSVIANPLDDEPLLGALASPACGVSPDTLWILRRASGAGRHLWPAVERVAGAWEPKLAEAEWLERIPPAERALLTAFHSHVSELRGVGTRLDLEQLIERAVTGSGYDLAVLTRRAGELRLSNIRKLMRLAREFEAREGRDLRGFLEFVAFRTDEDDEAVAATEAEDHDGVRVMTIHSSKGLEFPVVAVADLGRGLLLGGRPADLDLGRGRGGESRVGMRLARLGAPSVDLYEREELLEEGNELDAAEALRLFYVGATRARERLILSGVLARARPTEIKPGTSVAERLIAGLKIGLDQDSVVEIPAPEPRAGLAVRFENAELAVRLNRASPERAAELVEVATAPSPPLELGAGPPPIAAHAAPLTPLRPISYSALAEHRRCGYRFYVERVLGLGAADRNGDDRGASREERFGFGSAVHSLLEWSARHRWLDPGEEIVRRTLAAEGLDPGHEDLPARALAAVRGWTGSSLCAELSARGTRLSPERPLLLRLGDAVVRGSIDLLAEPPGGMPTVVDYKTDQLDGAAPAERAEGYRLQRALYALAASEALDAPRVRVAYVFLERPDQPVIAELGEEALARGRSELEAEAAAIAAGRFEVTSEPDWPLCHDCPARARLCPSPAQP